MPNKDWPKAKKALAEGQRPPQELEVSPCSRLYLLVYIYPHKCSLDSSVGGLVMALSWWQCSAGSELLKLFVAIYCGQCSVNIMNLTVHFPLALLHSVIAPLCHCSILSLLHSVIAPLCHCSTLSLLHSVMRLFGKLLSWLHWMDFVPPLILPKLHSMTGPLHTATAVTRGRSQAKAAHRQSSVVVASGVEQVRQA